MINTTHVKTAERWQNCWRYFVQFYTFEPCQTHTDSHLWRNFSHNFTESNVMNEFWSIRGRFHFRFHHSVGGILLDNLGGLVATFDTVSNCQKWASK